MSDHLSIERAIVRAEVIEALVDTHGSSSGHVALVDPRFVDLNGLVLLAVVLLRVGLLSEHDLVAIDDRQPLT